MKCSILLHPSLRWTKPFVPDIKVGRIIYIFWIPTNKIKVWCNAKQSPFSPNLKKHLWTTFCRCNWKYLNDLFTDCSVKTLFHFYINSSVLPFVLGRFVIFTRLFFPPVDNTISALQEDPASYGFVENSTTFYSLYLNVFQVAEVRGSSRVSSLCFSQTHMQKKCPLWNEWTERMSSINTE